VSKLARVGLAITQAGCSALVINALDQIAWLFNARGADIACNPVFLAYAVVCVDEAPRAAAAEAGDVCGACDGDEEVAVSATLYLRAQEGMAGHLASEGCVVLNDAAVEVPAIKRGPTVVIKDYAEFCADEVAAVVGDVGTVMFESSSATLAMSSTLQTERQRLVACSPVERFKARKNKEEIAGIIEAGKKDAAAICSYFAWLEAQLAAKTAVTEAQGADEIGRRRKCMQNCIGDSFPTISSTGANAAVIHYHAEHGSCAAIDPDSIYLCDTGGQYLDGTTDVTRTLHFGAPSEEEVRAYTRVLQGHIALATATFPSGTPGLMLEMLARKPLWGDGMNYLHGTGHGIGAYLNVHEGPFGIGGGSSHAERIVNSVRMQQFYLAPLEEGMYLSDEPGFYLDGKFGVRLESDLVIVSAETRFDWGARPYLCFAYTTPVPFCRELVDMSLLSPTEVRWIDNFHAECRNVLTKELFAQAARAAGDSEAAQSEDVKRSIEWVIKATEPLCAATHMG